MLYQLIVLGILPCILITIWIYRKDRYEREPISLVVLSFSYGAVSTLLAMLFESLFAGTADRNNLLEIAIFSFFVVGLFEELSKFIFLRFFIYPQAAFNEPIDGIVYSVAVGMGFAMVENLLYLTSDKGSLTMALSRALTAVPAHAAFGVLMGGYIGLAKFFPKKREQNLWAGLGLATFFHGLYDFFLLQNSYEVLSIFAVGVLLWGGYMSQNLIELGQNISPFKPKNEEKNEEEEF